MASSSIEIASNALLLIGDNAISAFTESTGGIIAERLYDDLLDDLLTSHHWRFATKKQLLNQLVTAPINGFAHAFQIPTDCLKIITINYSVPYEINGDQIHCNITPIEADYIFRPSEPSFPAWFVKALEYRLASELAMPVTEATTRAEFYAAQYRSQVDKAMGLDSQQRPNVAIRNNPFLTAHN